MKKTLYTLALLAFIIGCKDDDTPITPDTQTPKDSTTLYFPPISGTWETQSSASIGWNQDSINAMYTNLESNGTRAFIVLKDGKIVLEQYWGKTLLGDADFAENKNWYWASAAKTLTAFMVGKAEEDGHLKLSDKSSKYLGKGWTALTPEQEDKITVWHQLTMTNGLDDANGTPDDTSSSALTYLADAGTRWAYHNAPYTLLENVITAAVGQDFKTYFNTHLQNKIGMTGYWQWSGDNHLYLSNARSAARFGLLMQNNGVWDGTRLLNKEYVDESISKSQEINKGYGYLWWLNGSVNYRLPQTQVLIPGMILPKAPADTYAALGKNGQNVSVSPSKGIVIIRMGDSPDNALVPLLYLNDIWGMMDGVMN